MWKVRAMTSWAALLALASIWSVRAADPGTAAFERGALEQAVEHWSKTERELAQRGPVGARIQALVQLAHAQGELGQYERAAASLETARTAALAMSDPRRLALVTAALGNLYIATGPPERAEEYLRDAIARARALPDPALIAAAANDYGNLLSAEERYDAALAQYRQSIAAANDAHQPLTAARAEINAASALREKNEARQAANALDAALALLRTLEPTHEIAFTLVSAGLGYAELRAKLPD